MSFETKLQEYARLLVEVGVNIQKGQRLVLRSPVECAAFARLCALRCLCSRHSIPRFAPIRVEAPPGLVRCRRLPWAA